MKRRPRRRLALAFTIAVAVLCALLLAGWLHDLFVRGRAQAAPRPVGTSGAGGSGEAGRAGGAGRPEGNGAPRESLAEEVSDLRERNLRVPIDGADVERWKGSFEEVHGGHPHEAVDILAPRNTPIHAVADGRVAKLFLSKAGGLTVYEVDTSRRFIYYYAHLERYAGGIHEGDTLARGQVIGYVGTSGNAPPDTPHLHFTIFRVADPRRWWEGTAIDPYLVYTQEQ